MFEVILRRQIGCIIDGLRIRPYATMETPEGKIQLSRKKFCNTIDRFELIASQAHDLAQRSESRIILYRHTGYLDLSFLDELENGVVRITRTTKVFEIFMRRIHLSSHSGRQQIRMTDSNIANAKISLERNFETLLKFRNALQA